MARIILSFKREYKSEKSQYMLYKAEDGGAFTLNALLLKPNQCEKSNMASE